MTSIGSIITQGPNAGQIYTGQFGPTDIGGFATSVPMGSSTMRSSLTAKQYAAKTGDMKTRFFLVSLVIGILVLALMLFFLRKL